ncbi:hypothetical protein [Paludibaculum fermentans]|uniref:hypothetical protein n=1 Tax=Paludibaculum fermentans TaxID=1473598 RepID=UPI003EB8D4F0
MSRGKRHARLTSIVFRGQPQCPHAETMKTSLILLAALTAGIATAQQDTTPQPTKTDTPAQAAPIKEKKKKEKKVACSDIPPDQQILFRLPPEKEAEWARKRAEFQRKTGIYIPPPKPPKPLPPCPPAAPVPPAAPAPAKQ